MSDDKGSSHLRLLSVLLDAIYFFLFSLFHLLLSAFPCKYLRTLASLTSWNLQGIPGCNFTASYNGLSMCLFRDTPYTCLTSAAFLSHGGRFHNLFPGSLNLIQNHVAKAAKYCCFLGPKYGPSFKYILIFHMQIEKKMTLQQ